MSDTMTIERRAMRGRVEKRGDGTSRTIGGYALKFGTRSQNLGGFTETIAPAFLNKSAGDGWPGVMCRWNHEDAFLLGTTAAGTLRLAIDDVGLDYETDVPETRADVYELVQRGDVYQSSFAFITYEDEWSLDEFGYPLRTLISGRLIDTAPVNTPAYLDTSTGLRSLSEQRGIALEELDEMARAGRLAEVFTPAPIVIDLGAHTRSDGSPDSPKDAQAEATPNPVLELLRRQLQLKSRPAL